MSHNSRVDCTSSFLDVPVLDDKAQSVSLLHASFHSQLRKIHSYVRESRSMANEKRIAVMWQVPQEQVQHWREITSLRVCSFTNSRAAVEEHEDVPFLSPSVLSRLLAALCQ